MTDTVTFKDRDLYSSVLVGKRVVGHIYKTLSGRWFYSPKGQPLSKDSEQFPTRDACKKAIQ